jgi:hypothetical protein
MVFDDMIRWNDDELEDVDEGSPGGCRPSAVRAVYTVEG